MAKTAASAVRGITFEAVGYLCLRTPDRPVTPAQVAALPRSEVERRTVERP